MNIEEDIIQEFLQYLKNLITPTAMEIKKFKDIYHALFELGLDSEKLMLNVS